MAGRGSFSGNLSARKGAAYVAQSVKADAIAADWREIGSEEQQAIWNALDGKREHLVVNALAGVGKTFTGVQWCKHAPYNMGNIAYVAFNKHIAQELQCKLGTSGNVRAMTYHSLGLSIVRKCLGKVEVDAYKMDGLLDGMTLPVSNEWTERMLKYRAKHLAGLVKQYAFGPDVGFEEWRELVDHHGVDIEEGYEDCVFECTRKLLDGSLRDVKRVDFDDMVWLPKQLGLQGNKYTVMLVDEAQDTNLSQQWIALNSADRIVVVGDENQSIYAFRGADCRSMQRLVDALGSTARGVVELPLTVTRRCPKSHVELAQRLVPGIRALDDAEDGVVRECSMRQAVEGMRPGDLVVCRVNAELLGVAYKLLKAGMKAVVRGRDIGKGLEKLVEKACKIDGLNAGDGVDKLVYAAGELTAVEAAKLRAIPKGRGEMRAAAVEDKYDCLCALSGSADKIGELQTALGRLFADFTDDGKPNNAVVLGTVHRTKGLESERVWVLRPELLPHPMARQEWERVQEKNILYIALTRAKKELVWVGGGQPALLY